MLTLLVVGAVLLVGIQRLLELRISRRNERYLRARGAMEYGRGHYPAMVALHSAWLVSTLIESLLRGPQLLSWWLLALTIFLAVQPLRYWAITSLGRRWNTKILALRGERLISRGPYRFMRHPNYVVVVVEVLAFPLVFGAWLTAIAFTVLNALLLYVRIREEDKVLSAGSTR